MKLDDKIKQYEGCVSDSVLAQRPSENPSLQKILHIYQRFLREMQSGGLQFGPLNTQFEGTKYILQTMHRQLRIDLSAELVTRLSFALSAYQNEPSFEWSGVFLTALIDRVHQCTGQNEYVLILHQLEKKINYLCLDSSDVSVTVHGDLGENTAEDMQSGVLHVHGSVGHNAGSFMTGGALIVEGCSGSIAQHASNCFIHVKKDVDYFVAMSMYSGTVLIDGTVNGDVGRSLISGKVHVRGDVSLVVGEEMRGGRIIVDGNVDTAGYKLKGGTIHINGRYVRHSRARTGTGKIYHKGRQVWPR